MTVQGGEFDRQGLYKVGLLPCFTMLTPGTPRKSFKITSGCLLEKLINYYQQALKLCILRHTLCRQYKK